jgi:hypothetical protein
MAIGNYISASGTYITFPPGIAASLASGITPPSAFNTKTEAVVFNGNLVPDHNVRNPGVFTQGTSPEWTAPKINNDSNA